MLKITNLKVNREGKEILNGVNLSIKKGELHVLMGPNGSGKSTFANSIMGNPLYEVIEGKALIDDKPILDLSPDKRAKEGLFLAFQHPVEVEGVSMRGFLRTVYEELGKPLENFPNDLRKGLKLLGINSEFMDRCLNEGFSGGEMKKGEVLQLALFSPKYAILDEIDSGLDISALKTVAEGVTAIRKANSKLGVLVITHYTRILKYLDVDYVHIMSDGRIVKSGGKGLAKKVEEEGY